MSDGKLFHRIIERGKKLVSVDDFLQQGRDTDFFENYNHSGKRVVAKALSDKEGPSSTWSWRTTPMCDSQTAVAIEVRQSGAGGRTVLAVWPTCWYFPRSTRGRHTRAVVGLLQWRSSEELLTWAYVVGGAECQSSWHSRYTHDQCGLARTSGSQQNNTRNSSLILEDGNRLGGGGFRCGKWKRKLYT